MRRFLQENQKMLFGIIIPAIFGLLTFVIAFLPLFNSVFPPAPTPTLPADFMLIPTQIAALNTQVAFIDQTVKSVSQIPTDVAVSLQLSQIQSSLDALSKRLEALEKAILDDPAKAIELPLLSRDLETLRESQKTDIQNVQNNVNQFMDLGKWLIGLIATSIFGLAISNALSRPSKEKEKEKEKA